MRIIAPKLFLAAALTGSCLPAIARWQPETFESGKITHYVASSNTSNRDTLEIFCTSRDLRPSLALYFVHQRFGRRRPYTLDIRIDDNPPIPLVATRHAMAYTAPEFPTILLDQLARGNHATINYISDLEKTESIRISLRGSSSAIAEVMKSCQRKSNEKKTEGNS